MTTAEITKSTPSRPPAPSAADFGGELFNIVSGVGLALVSFLALIPGLLPSLLLVGVVAAVVLIPVLVVGAMVGLVAGLLVLVARVRFVLVGRTATSSASRGRASGE